MSYLRCCEIKIFFFNPTKLSFVSFSTIFYLFFLLCGKVRRFWVLAAIEESFPAKRFEHRPKKILFYVIIFVDFPSDAKRVKVGLSEKIRQFPN